MATQTIDFAARRRAALRKARVAGAGFVLVSRPEDVSYLSGFTGEDSYVLIGPRLAALITDGRFDEQARLECPGVQVLVRQGAMLPVLKDALKPHGRAALAVQSDHVTLRGHQTISDGLKHRKVIGVADVTTDGRMIKDAAELAAIKKAIAVAEGGFTDLTSRGRRFFIGKTERQIAAELEYRMRLRGASKPSFDTIVAAGANGSKPHYRAGDVVIGRDTAVLIDWGAMVDGYCSDLTRVVFTGKIPPKLAQVYEVVLRAQTAGQAAIRAGVSVKTPDAAARKVIDAAGYGKQFVHGLGHGVGLAIHEAPSLGRLAKGKLRPGMVVTVEPGIYLPGEGGVRIEDDVLVGPRGPLRLTTLASDMDAMVLR